MVPLGEGKLATEYGITGWSEGAAFDAAVIGFQAWRATLCASISKLSCMSPGCKRNRKKASRSSGKPLI